jgi:selenocysteine lyase/cysteine desulfurase
VDYLADLGRHIDPSAGTRRAALQSAYRAIHSHESRLAEIMIRGLLEIPGLKLYGVSDPAKLDRRCPTFAVRTANHTPLQLATRLGDRGFFTWDGNYYAINLSERLDVEKDGGFLRIGLAHYNTREEVTRLLAALKEISN